MPVLANFRQRLASMIAPTAMPVVRPHPNMVPAGQQRLHAAQSAPYEAGAHGRRAIGWNTSTLGPNSLLWENLPQLVSRSRDQVRNNPYCTSAIDKFESNVVGSGIQAHWPDERVHELWHKSRLETDFAGQLDFYGVQALIAREIFEAGEVFVRTRLRPSSEGLAVPLQLQLIESEQCPVFLSVLPSPSAGDNAVRTGIEFSPDGKRVAYRMYKEHPGDTMVYALDAFQYVRIPADEIFHIMKPLRAGQLRGQPILSPVLTLCYELEQYSDATLVRQKVAAMFAGFINKTSPEDEIMTPAAGTTTSLVDSQLTPDYNPYPYLNPGTDISKLEPGTMMDLYPGESITFSNPPDAHDYDNLMRSLLHKFAAGCHMTYEMLTGDLERVNYSSIRAGMLEFQKGCEQFQANIIIHQFCRPYARRWLKEAVISGKIKLGMKYLSDPASFEPMWISPAWPWVDPQKEVAAYKDAVRSGFTSRTRVVRGQGEDPAIIDREQAADQERANKLGLLYDSDPNKPMNTRETITVPDPGLAGEQDPSESNEQVKPVVPIKPDKKQKKGPVPAQKAADSESSLLQ